MAPNLFQVWVWSLSRACASDMQSILSQLTLQLIIYFHIFPSCSVMRFDMEDSVYKMIKNLDHSQSGSNVEYGRYCEQNVQKSWSLSEWIPTTSKYGRYYEQDVQKVLKNPDHCQSGSHPRCVIRDNWGEGARGGGRQRLMLSTFLINWQTKGSFIEFWFLHQQTFANKIHWPENRFLVFIQSVTVTVSLCTCKTNYNLASANLSPTEIWRVKGDIWAPS